MRPLIAAGILLSLALPASAHAGTVTAEFGPDARQVDLLAAAAGDIEEAATA